MSIEAQRIPRWAEFQSAVAFWRSSALRGRPYRVRDRGTSERVPGGRACSVTVPNTNRIMNRLLRSFGGKAASTNVQSDLLDVSGDATR